MIKLCPITPFEIKLCTYVGKRRNAFARARKYTCKQNQKVEDSLSNDILGAKGEFNLAKHFQLRWLFNIGPIDHIDIEPDIEVRSRTQINGRLYVYKSESEIINGLPKKIALVTSDGPESSAFYFGGWIWCRDAKRIEYLENNGRGEQFVISQRKLNLNPKELINDPKTVSKVFQRMPSQAI